MPMVNNNHGHILGNGSLNAESDKKIQILRFYMVQVLTKHWLNKTHRLRRLCFSIYAQRCPSFAMPTYKEKIYLHIMHIYAFAALTDIAAIVYNNGARRTDHPLNIGIT